MQEENIRDAVRALRHSIKTDEGAPISQTEFGRLIGKSLNTVQRYEGLVAPSGAALVALEKLALERDQPEIAKVFRQALRVELGIPADAVHVGGGPMRVGGLSMEVQLPPNWDFDEFKANYVDFTDILKGEQYEAERKAWAKIRASVAKKRQVKS